MPEIIRLNSTRPGLTAASYVLTIAILPCVSADSCAPFDVTILSVIAVESSSFIVYTITNLYRPVPQMLRPQLLGHWALDWQ